MSPHALPAELTDHIIDFLHADTRALKACSLASRTLRPAARFHLFQTLNFPSAKAGYAFWELLQASPELGRRALVANFAKITAGAAESERGAPSDVGLPLRDERGPGLSANGHDSNVRGDAYGRASTPVQAIDCSTLWGTIFHTLPAVHTLEFLFLDLITPRDGAALRHHITHAFPATRTLTLQYVRVPAFVDFIALLRSFPRLEKCTLRGLSWEDDDAPVAAPVLPFGHVDGSVVAPQQAPPLEELNLGRDLDLPTLANWLLDAHLCANLRKLSVCAAFERDAVVLADVIRAAGPKLEELALDWYAESHNDVGLPHELTSALSTLTSLRALQLCCPIRHNGTLSWVHTAISHLPLPLPTLESVSFEIRLLGNIDAIDWRAVDRTLTSDREPALASTGTTPGPGGADPKSKRFPNLKVVRFRVKTWHTAVQRGPAEACGALQERMPLVRARGILQFCD